jgi:hypothetical protein
MEVFRMEFYRIEFEDGYIRYIEASSLVDAYVKGIESTESRVLSVISARDYFYKVVIK